MLETKIECFIKVRAFVHLNDPYVFNRYVNGTSLVAITQGVQYKTTFPRNPVICSVIKRIYKTSKFTMDPHVLNSSGQNFYLHPGVYQDHLKQHWLKVTISI